MNLSRAGRVPYLHFKKRRYAQLLHVFKGTGSIEHLKRSTIDCRYTQGIVLRKGLGFTLIDHTDAQPGIPERTGQGQSGDAATGDNDIIVACVRNRHQTGLRPSPDVRPLSPMLCFAS